MSHAALPVRLGLAIDAATSHALVDRLVAAFEAASKAAAETAPGTEGAARALAPDVLVERYEPSTDPALAMLDALWRLEARGAHAAVVPGAADPALLRALQTETRLALLAAPLAAPLPGALAEPLDAAACARYAAAALAAAPVEDEGAFRLGIVGGLGPAATVDFIGKLIRFTPAQRDQDHLRLIVEHNPRIPDRSAHLLGVGDEDPALALYAACRRLEQGGAAAIVIPCNTAHAFAARLQPRLAIPIVNMLTETASDIVRVHGRQARVGLLGTDATIATRVYHDAAAAVGLALMTPDAAHQALVMQAIFGPDGVKTRGPNEAAAAMLDRAIGHLAAQGAEVAILGCTELPLLAQESASHAVDGHRIALADPTAILARRCVALALDQEARRSCSAKASVAASVYSSSAPAGTPRASRVTLSPRDLSISDR